jgi:hypothetical protein
MTFDMASDTRELGKNGYARDNKTKYLWLISPGAAVSGGRLEI